jgi:hypothetical protein
MANRSQHQLAYYLGLLKEEELIEFQLQLPNKTLSKSFSGTKSVQPEMANSMKVASCLVAQYGDQLA